MSKRYKKRPKPNPLGSVRVCTYADTQYPRLRPPPEPRAVRKSELERLERRERERPESLTDDDRKRLAQLRRYRAEHECECDEWEQEMNSAVED